MVTSKHLVAALLCLTLAACQETLFGRLNEREANDVVAALGEVKIDASKKHVKDDIWSVLVDRSDFDGAVRMLNALGVPNTGFSGLQETFKKQGLASSPTEERARLMLAQSQELEKSIRVIDCVVNARVHVSIPAPDRFVAAAQDSTIAILVKHRPGCVVDTLPAQLKSLAVNAVENTRAEFVSVMLTPALSFTSKEAATNTKSIFQVAGFSGWVLLMLFMGCALWGLSRISAVAQRIQRIIPMPKKNRTEASKVGLPGAE